MSGITKIRWESEGESSIYRIATRVSVYISPIRIFSVSYIANTIIDYIKYWNSLVVVNQVRHFIYSYSKGQYEQKREDIQNVRGSKGFKPV